jgi:hypothetical protein
VSEGAAEPPDDAWTELGRDEYDKYWSTFNSRFEFRAGVSPDAWPAIREPVPSLTFDLSVIADGPRRGAAYDAINAEALRAFVWALPDAELVVLDWNHPAYRFRPADQASAWRPGWRVPVYPDGDYYAFFTQDFTEGTFGHPWERTLCVIGERLGASLGRSLETWLPIRRRDGDTA